MCVNELLKELGTLARESGGGALPEILEPQRVRAVAVFLDDGRVVLVNLNGGETA